MFTLGISGILAAFDGQTGRLLWRTEAPAEAPYFSAASSPLGVPGLVIVHPGNYEALTAFDVSSGAVKWKTGAGGFFMSPTLATLQGVPQVVSVTQAGVMSVTPSDGRHAVGVPMARRQAGRHHANRARRSGDRQRRGLRRDGPPSGAARRRVDGGQGLGDQPTRRCTSATRWWWTRRCTGSRPKPGVSCLRWTCATGTRAGLGRPRQATNVAVTKAGNYPAAAGG